MPGTSSAALKKAAANEREPNMRLTKLAAAALTGLAATLTAPLAAMAQGLPIIGHPVDGGMGFQPAVTKSAQDLQWLDGTLLIIITAITVFVTGLLIWVAIRFNAKRNPTPAGFTHNSPLEVAWTLIPVLILLYIGVVSLPILFNQQEIPKADITIKATGNQWYWSYEYVDEGVTFDSYMLDGSVKVASLGDDQPMGTPEILDDIAVQKLEALGYSRNEFLLATDTAMVIPVGKTIVVQVTGADVIHAWAVPAFGVMHSAVPGRLGEVWFKADREGIYFGQCTSLCGKSHAYMPITVKVVSEAVYAKWLEGAKAGNVQLTAEAMAAGAPVDVAASN